MPLQTAIIIETNSSETLRVIPYWMPEEGNIDSTEVLITAVKAHTSLVQGSNEDNEPPRTQWGTRKGKK